MIGTYIQIQSTPVVAYIALGILAMELPIDDIAKLGVAGSCLLLVWWMIARTLPAMATIQTDALKNLTEAYRQSVADLMKLHHETTDKVVQANKDTADRLGQHLDEVKNVISEAAKSESALLRELIHQR